jgi:hypothetical protein
MWKLERWETKIENCEVTPQAIWPVAKSLTKRGGPKASTAIHSPLGPVFYPNEKANVIANYLEYLFTPHKVRDTEHKRRVEAQVQTLLTTVDENPPVKLRPCDVSKEIRSLKLGKACGIYGIPNDCLRHFPRRYLVHVTFFFNHGLRLCHFPAPWKEAKIIALPKPGKKPKLPENLGPISLLSTTGKLSDKLILKTIHRHIAEINFLTQVNLASVHVTARHTNV